MKRGPRFLLAAAMLAGAAWAGFSRSQPSRPGDGGPAIKATIDGPSRLAFDAAGNLFVYEDGDDRPPAIREILLGTQTITTVLVGCDQNKYPPQKDDCLGPVGELLVAGNDRLLATEFTRNRVRSFDLRSGALSLVAGNGSLKSSGDGAPATAAGVVDPRCAAMDRFGNLFVCEPHRVRRVDAKTGIITTVAGTGKDGAIGDHGPAVQARFTWISSIAVDSDGSLFIADARGDDHVSFSGRIRRLDAKTGIVKTIAGSGRVGRFFAFDIADGPALRADILSPSGLVLDGRGDLLFSNLESRICKIDLETGILTTIVGDGNAGFDGDGGPAIKAHIDVFGMALDPQGNLFLADWQHNRIRRVDRASGIITTVAGNGRPRRGPFSRID